MTLLLLIAAVTGAWADGDTKYTVTFKANGKTKTVENVTLPHTFKCDVNENGELDLIIKQLYELSGGYCVGVAPTSSGSENITCGLDNSSQFITISAPFEGTATVTGKYFDSDEIQFNYSLEISIPGYIDGPAVTLNDTKTEASFEMPTYDVNFSYELVRDMSVQMQAQVGDDAAKEPRYRVQRNGESWVPADLNLQQVQALFSLKDLIEDKTLNLTSFNDSIYAVDAEGNPIGDAMTFQNFTFAPGRYCVTVTAPQGIAYEGTTAPSNIFELYQGYEVTVPAGEYATFYKDENLYTDDEDAVLYTIANVTATEAQLSDAIKVAPAETPLLVYNKSEESKTFLLIPTTDVADEVTPATQFVGTLEATTIPASATGADNYALNGYAFVWVKTAIEVGANKCWLQIGDQPAAARAMTRSIVGGGDTTNMDDVRWQMEDGNYYDLQGRKVEKPNRKGIYIHNGQKVIVR